MPKKRENSKLFQPELILSPSGESTNIETVTGTLNTIFTPKVLMAGLDATSGTLPSEQDIFSTAFNLHNLGIRTAVITYGLSHRMSTDAGPGTTTFKINAGEFDASLTTLATVLSTEQASQSNRAVSYTGSIIVYSAFDEETEGTTLGNMAASGVRNNNPNIYANTGVAFNGAVDLLTVDLQKDIIVELTLQSSDAGTTFSDFYGYLIMTPASDEIPWDGTGEDDGWGIG